ncbi:helix-turn-helix domain-containing protein [Fructilactobacillus florum]|uniref:HTH cro/C1-type domain-containing protein n=1 Tax=Fructilactobacillus florum DSM 22689 = JCM 16035 TaxID=1423745 RepID=A0A0R2CND8_9LACO|nr:helix-turn-helix transcriptional regulator [Fructilactobacillus florum]KRM89347.1 hypothetical protein FC87_GL000529 [Fructilactobacillus florum DSM 22689 = JCM 16035]
MWPKIECILTENNLTPRKLSQMAGLKNSSTIYALKNGQIKKPSFELMVKIANALNVSLDVFK